MNFNWYGNDSDPSGIAEFNLRGWPLIKVELSCFTQAVALSNLMDQFKQSGIKEGQTRLLDALHFDLRMDAKDAMKEVTE